MPLAYVRLEEKSKNHSLFCMSDKMLVWNDWNPSWKIVLISNQYFSIWLKAAEEIHGLIKE